MLPFPDSLPALPAPGGSNVPWPTFSIPNEDRQAIIAGKLPQINLDRAVSPSIRAFPSAPPSHSWGDPQAAPASPAPPSNPAPQPQTWGVPQTATPWASVPPTPVYNPAPPSLAWGASQPHPPADPWTKPVQPAPVYHPAPQSPAWGDSRLPLDSLPTLQSIPVPDPPRYKTLSISRSALPKASVSPKPIQAASLNAPGPSTLASRPVRPGSSTTRNTVTPPVAPPMTPTVPARPSNLGKASLTLAIYSLIFSIVVLLPQNIYIVSLILLLGLVFIFGVTSWRKSTPGSQERVQAGWGITIAIIAVISELARIIFHK